MDKANQPQSNRPIDTDPLAWWTNAIIGLFISSAFASTMFLLAFTIKKDIPHWSTTISTFVLAFIGLWIGAGMFRMILRDGVVATFSGAHEFDKIDEMKTTIGKLY